MFFILSTGRSGTMTIAELFSTSPDCVCLHEPDPPLIAEATKYLYKEMEHYALVKLVSKTRPSLLDGKRYGESNHKLSMLIPALRDAFPDAQFIWLIRDGRDVAASAYQRQWYDPDRNSKWEQYRIRADKVAEMSHRDWLGLNQLEKCMWNWSYVNRLIEKHLKEYDCTYEFVRLEELDQATHRLFEFLQITVPSNLSIPHLNVAVGKTGQKWRSWKPQETLMFEQLCGNEMDKWYPEWRSETNFVPQFTQMQTLRLKWERTLRSYFNRETLLGNRKLVAFARRTILQEK